MWGFAWFVYELYYLIVVAGLARFDFGISDPLKK
jgi:hypothetical protein